ncbi:efflux transporter outer membrane subunit [Collimonas sp. OK242]|uniref:efflux transporter outer membrane subunit n=1 Tax=Collimonas sp. OK242 TaxID=1798195 RepID=UPI000B889FB1|nr:efflux transporter outer membrane subunit [Collimonas sp. OK242]
MCINAHLYSQLRTCAALLAALALAACTVGPDFVRPAPPEVDRYTREPMPAAMAADGNVQHVIPGAAVPADWWRMFNSAQLDTMVSQAIANNPTLEASQATLRQSQDNLRAGYGVFFPQISAGLDAVRERNAPVTNGLQSSGSIFNVVTLSGSISYALDVFGGQRRTVEGLRAQADNQRYAGQAAYLTLSANVVNTTIARAGYAAQVRATEQLIEMENQQLDATKAQFRAGTSAYSSVLGLQSLIAANRAALAPLRQRMDQAEHLLAILQGRMPSQASLPDVDLNQLALPADLPLSLPSDLVRQRPDILSAEAQLHVASANIGVATAAMFPSFSLNGSYGVAGSSFGNLSAASGKFWSIGPALSIPLFRGGSLWFGRKAAIDAYQASLATYRQVVLSAFAQVADSLKALQHDAEALEAQAESQRAAGEALHLLQVSYRAGLAAYLDVLAADVQYQQATISYLQAVALRQQDTVALFVALGGGWRNAPDSSQEGKAL